MSASTPWRALHEALWALRLRLESPVALLLPAAALALTSAPAPAQIKLHSVHGSAAFDELGTAVAAAGDVDADGVPDWIAGAPRDATGGQQGYARVYSGVDGSVLHQFDGTLASDEFGQTLDGAGDVDGDGFDDLVVGSRYDTLGDPTGRAQVFSGQSGAVLHTFFGELDANFLDQPVAGVGAVDGDGRPDVLVGEPNYSLVAPSGGRVRVYSGATGAVLREVTGALAERLGSSAAAAGDVDADGVPDFVVGGVPNFSAGVTGHLWVFSGATGAVLHAISGAGLTDQFGTSVSGAGDVDGDGYADVIVGAPADNTAGTNAGLARVYSGLDGSTLYTRFGGGAVTGFGRDVCGAGDRNGDGFDDFMVSADHSGVGSGTGSARIYSGADGQQLYQLLSKVPNDSFGISIATLGDVDGDGGIDYAVGGYSGDVGFSSTGTVYVLSLASTHSTYCTSTPNSTGVPATLDATGYGTYSSNDLVLHGADLPPNQFALVIASSTQGFSALGNGFLCLAPHIWRIPPIFTSSASGTITAPVNLNSSPWNSLVQVGETWNFQLWYRDGAGGGAGFNLTDGVTATFVP